MRYQIIYDGNCNLCSSLVQVLAKLDQGQRFTYSPMQDRGALAQWGISSEDCELGMILIDTADPQKRWQGSEAAEEIGRLLPGGEGLIQVYREIPGLKTLGDRLYEQIRDHRYEWFGQRETLYMCSLDSQCTHLNSKSRQAK
ncbi:DCC1-like thiol-disulfide oxidoreductase family protein [Roseofilum sp. BLCC_M154]|uniref:DCC1-like thiol-disulfide oxidoreductase family protein n=1 Tax=Roseofilum acuticapitatum BLCC-M154 TaxID=3022444 RepID=A0ABT7ANA2_9CYAN|nr:DCC1-like thiol-disulfide oxidoreductase family protein [Roseofilum acuticapitatum]MDJ1168365.1 DCC1-like thiol-disulfide oxidoreductase family protein [Roseofilum acuticapitatum BLCC-M154]